MLRVIWAVMLWIGVIWLLCTWPLVGLIGGGVIFLALVVIALRQLEREDAEMIARVQGRGR